MSETQRIRRKLLTSIINAKTGDYVLQALTAAAMKPEGW